MRILILHRSRLFASCLAEVLDRPPGSQAQQIEPSGPDPLGQTQGGEPDIVLIDLELPDHQALSVIQEVGGRWERARLVALLASEKHPDVPACVRAGVSGLLLEESSLEELKTALETVHRGDFFCSPRLARSLFRLLATAPAGSTPDSQSPNPLTQREVEVVRLLAEGLSNKQIARRLSVSLYTVKNHVHKILDKLQVQSRHEAADLAHRRRLVGRAPR